MQKNTFLQLLDNSSDILCGLNDAWEFVWINKTGNKYFPFQETYNSKTKFLDQFHEEDQAMLKKVLTKAKSRPNQELHFNAKYLLENGNMALQWSFTWNEDEKVLYGIAYNEKKLFSFEKDESYDLLFINSALPKIIYSLEKHHILDVNDSAINAYGYSKKEFLDLKITDLIVKAEIQNFLTLHKNLSKKSFLTPFGVFTYLKKDETRLKMEVSGQSFTGNNVDKVLISCLDVTEKYQNNYFEFLEHEIMKKALEKEIDLRSLFTSYIKGLEKIFPDMKASILKVEDGRIWHMASTLPSSFKIAINGESIGPKVGSCGTAAFLKKRIVVADISTDPLWDTYKSLALPIGLKACWSQPIFNTRKEVIATFANYYSTIRKPSEKQLEIFERSAALIGIIFENQQNSNALRSKINQFNYVHKATNDAIYDRDLKSNKISWGQSYQNLFGHILDEDSVSPAQWRSLVHPKDLEETIQSLETFLTDTKQERWQAKYRFKKANGNYAFVEDKGYVIRDLEGVAVRMIGVLSDISESRLANIKKGILTEFNHIFNNSATLKRALEQINKLILKRGGYCLSEIWLLNSSKKELELYSSFASEEAEIFYSTNNVTTFKKGEGFPGSVWERPQITLVNWRQYNEKLVRKESAAKANLKNFISIPLIQDNQFTGVWVCGEAHEESSFETIQKIGQEIATNLASEINRKQLEEELFHIFQLAPDIICTLNSEGIFKRMNNAGCQLLEYSNNEILQMTYNQLSYSKNKGILSEEAQDFYKQGKTYRFESRYLTKSGKIIWLDWNCSASTTEGLIYAVAKDITEKKQLQILLDDASKMALVGSWEIDILNKSIYWSKITRKIHEASNEYVPDLETAINHFQEDVRKEVYHVIDRAIKEGVSWDLELPIITCKNNRKWVRSIGRPEYKDGHCIRLYGSFQDINHHKKTEMKLYDTLAEKREILERIKDSFFAVDKNFIVTYWNKSAEEALQTPKESILGKNLWDLFSDTVDRPTYKFYIEALTTGKAVHFEDFYEPLDRWFDVNVYPSESGISVYFKDVTQRKKTEEEVRVINKRLKDIAWQQSHSVRAPVARLMSIIDLIKHGDLSNSEKEDFLKDILTSANDIDSIIRDISKKTNMIDFNN